MENSFQTSYLGKGTTRPEIRGGEKQVMSPTDKPDADVKKEVPREERLKKLKQLITAREDDAANVLKMWLQQEQEDKKKKRR